jgi:hypothetical protein
MNWRVADFAKYEGDGGKGEWKSGILTIMLESWDAFGGEIGRLLKFGDFIWRGQRQDWPLKSKFQRNVKNNRAEVLAKLTDTFLREVKGRRGPNPAPLDTNEKIWSLGQHYGLPTPLLDWTESPFVAAYFAYWEKRLQEDKPYHFVYGLSGDLLRWGPASPEGKRTGQYIWIIDNPLDENTRLLSQRGLFTLPGSAEIEIGEVVQRCYAADVKKGVQRIILVKIAIPDTEREKCLRNLNTMNINHATLFPDLTGAAIYCAMKLEIENY